MTARRVMMTAGLAVSVVLANAVHAQAPAGSSEPAVSPATTAKPSELASISPDVARALAYVESLGLADLQAMQLEELLQTVDVADRPAIAAKLTEVYGQLLQQTLDPAERAKVVQRARELVKSAPATEGLVLRLGLLRQEYAVLEEDAERFRLRALSDARRLEVAAELQEVQRRLVNVVQELSTRETELNRQRDRATGRGAERLEKEFSKTADNQRDARYLLGWCSYYLALLSPIDSEVQQNYARQAVTNFGRLFGSSDPKPEQIDDNLLSREAVARTAGGIAMSLALAGDGRGARAWLEKLDESITMAATVRPLVIRWQIASYSHLGRRDNARWADLDQAVRKARTRGQQQAAVASGLPAEATAGLDEISARLLAIVCMEASDRSGFARELASIAVTDLIRHGRTASVLDLARRYGTATLSDLASQEKDATGPAAVVGRYIQSRLTLASVLEVLEQRGLPTNEPVAEPRLRGELAEASRVLASALDDPQARATLGIEHVQGRQLLGRSQLLAGEMRQAAETLARAAEEARSVPGQGSLHEECLSMAIAVLEKARQAEKVTAEQLAIAQRLDQLSLLYMRQFPGTDRAAAIAMQQAAADQADPEQILSVLLSVEPTSPVFLASRQQAAGLLYRLVRRASQEQRLAAANRYLPIGLQVWNLQKNQIDQSSGADGSAATTSTTTTIEAAIVTGRQLLDVLLGQTPVDTDTTRQVLSRLSTLIARQGPTEANRAGALRAELALRLFQLETASGNPAEADRALEDLGALAAAEGGGAINPGGGSSTLSAGRLYVTALRLAIVNDDAQRRGTTDEKIIASASERLIRHGTMILARGEMQGEALRQDAGLQALVARLAEASHDMFTRKQHAQAIDLALEADARLLSVTPGRVDSLVRTAELTEVRGDLASAERRWFTISQGAASGSELWGKATYNRLRLMAMTDAAAAGIAARQIMVLNPVQPEPWKSKIAELANVMPPQAAPTENAGGAEGLPPEGGGR
jgi:hypothetical protein